MDHLSLTSAQSNLGVADWINVKHSQFGAVGDRKNDDTSAIQAAIDYAASKARTGRVYIPAGNYRITKTLTIPENTRLVGAGFDGGANFYTNNGSVLLFEAPLDVGIDTKGGFVTLENLVITGTYKVNKLIRVTTHWVTIRNNRFLNPAPGGSAIWGGASLYTDITGNVFSLQGARGIDLLESNHDVAYYGTNWSWIRDNSIFAREAAIRVSGDVIISGNNIEGSVDTDPGVVVLGDTSVGYIRLLNNYFELKGSDLPLNWLPPVENEEELPKSGNERGDIRVNLTTREIHGWTGLEWVKRLFTYPKTITQWQSPVGNEESLPTTGNTLGDGCFAAQEMTIHRWDGSAWISEGSLKAALNAVYVNRNPGRLVVTNNTLFGASKNLPRSRAFSGGRYYYGTFENNNINRFEQVFAWGFYSVDAGQTILGGNSYVNCGDTIYSFFGPVIDGAHTNRPQVLIQDARINNKQPPLRVSSAPVSRAFANIKPGKVDIRLSNGPLYVIFNYDTPILTISDLSADYVGLEFQIYFQQPARLTHSLFGLSCNSDLTIPRGYILEFLVDWQGRVREIGDLSQRIKEQSEGAKLPNLSTSERDALVNPANGTLIYNTTTGKIEAYASGVWVSLHWVNRSFELTWLSHHPVHSSLKLTNG